MKTSKVLRILGIFMGLYALVTAAPIAAHSAEDEANPAPEIVTAPEAPDAPDAAEAPKAPEAPAPAAAAATPAVVPDAAATAPAAPAAADAAAPKPSADITEPEAKDFVDSWSSIKEDTVKPGRTAFKRAQAETADLLKEAPEMDTKVGDAIASVEPKRAELAARSAELIKQAEAKKNPQFVAMLEQEMATRESLGKELSLALSKDREELADFTKKMTDWQTRGPELDKQADALDAEADAAIAEIKAKPADFATGEPYDKMVERRDAASERAAVYKEQSDNMSEALGNWKERLELVKSRLISLKEAQSEWTLLMDRRTKEFKEMA